MAMRHVRIGRLVLVLGALFLVMTIVFALVRSE